MKISFIAFLLPIGLCAQSAPPVKRALLPMVNDVIIDCPSGAVAHDRCGANGVCEPGKVCGAMDQKMAALSMERANMVGGQQQPVQQMQDPVFQEKMKHMSTEELIAMGQRMQQASPGGSLPLNSMGTAQERALMAEYQRLVQDHATFMATLANEMDAAMKALSATIEKLEAAEAKAIAACPRKQGAEMSQVDPACCARTRKSYHDQKAKVLSDWLASTSKTLHDQRERISMRFTATEQRLADVSYGDKATSQMYFSMVGELQTQITGGIGTLQANATYLWGRACETQGLIERQRDCL